MTGDRIHSIISKTLSVPNQTSLAARYHGVTSAHRVGPTPSSHQTLSACRNHRPPGLHPAPKLHSALPVAPSSLRLLPHCVRPRDALCGPAQIVDTQGSVSTCECLICQSLMHACLLATAGLWHLTLELLPLSTVRGYKAQNPNQERPN